MRFFTVARVALLMAPAMVAAQSAYLASCNEPLYGGYPEMSSGSLSGWCANTDGGACKSSLDMDYCIANDNGVMVARVNGGFTGSCSLPCSWDSTTSEYTCHCKNAAGVEVLSTLYLNDFVGNEYGTLACFGIVGKDTDYCRYD